MMSQKLFEAMIAARDVQITALVKANQLPSDDIERWLAVYYYRNGYTAGFRSAVAIIAKSMAGRR